MTAFFKRPATAVTLLMVFAATHRGVPANGQGAPEVPSSQRESEREQTPISETDARLSNAPPSADDMNKAQQTEKEEADAQADEQRDPMMELLEEMQILFDQIQDLRLELAQARLERNEAARQLEELERFVEDHEALGSAYSEYRGVKEVAERESRQRQLELRRAEYEREKAARRARYQQARAERLAENADRQRLSGYDRAGFASVGLDVYTSRMSFYYFTSDTTRQRIDWEDEIGHYLRLYPSSRIDFSKMTISGSVMNAAEETRNIGIAIIFFDEDNTQVGHEIVQINNARPDVPYPFTSEVQMALNRPFSSSSTYVLYADPVAVDETDEPADDAAPVN